MNKRFIFQMCFHTAPCSSTTNAIYHHTEYYMKNNKSYTNLSKNKQYEKQLILFTMCFSIGFVYPIVFITNKPINYVIKYAMNTDFS